MLGNQCMGRDTLNPVTLAGIQDDGIHACICEGCNPVLVLFSRTHCRAHSQTSRAVQTWLRLAAGLSCMLLRAGLTSVSEKKRNFRLSHLVLETVPMDLIKPF